MTLEALLPRLKAALDLAEVPYMLTGSVASSAHGIPRSTLDVDIVIAPSTQQLLSLVRQFSSTLYYADEQQAMQALERKSQFNVIDYATGWKVDFIIAEDSAYSRAALARRRQLEIAGTHLWIASPEDVLIAKLRWAKLSGSERQLEDAKGIVKTQVTSLDLRYIEQWTTELDLMRLWASVRG